MLVSTSDIANKKKTFKVHFLQSVAYLLFSAFSRLKNRHSKSLKSFDLFTDLPKFFIFRIPLLDKYQWCILGEF